MGLSRGGCRGDPAWGLLEPRTCSHPRPRRFSEVCPWGRPPGALSRQCPAPGALLPWDSPALWELAYVTGRGRPGTCVLKTALYPLGRGGPRGSSCPASPCVLGHMPSRLCVWLRGRAQAPGVTAGMKRVPERELEQPGACVPSGALAVGGALLSAAPGAFHRGRPVFVGGKAWG